MKVAVADVADVADVVFALPGVSKKMPLTTAFQPPVRVTVMVAWPVMFQSR